MEDKWLRDLDGLDVGVDVHGFAPMSAEEVEFFLNALEKGYYDAEVFC